MKKEHAHAGKYAVKMDQLKLPDNFPSSLTTSQPNQQQKVQVRAPAEIQQWIDCDASKDTVPIEKSLPMKTQTTPRTGQSSPMLIP